MEKNMILDFVRPFYNHKDLMHNMWHIELVIKYVDKVIDWGKYSVDYNKLIMAAYFHGFIYSNEKEIRDWLRGQSFCEKDIDIIVIIANESQRPEVPQTLEGKILHDAHVIEGGETYLLTKCLLTGTARGQTLVETIEYIDKYVIDSNRCYLPETITLLKKANSLTKEFISKLKKDIM